MKRKHRVPILWACAAVAAGAILGLAWLAGQAPNTGSPVPARDGRQETGNDPPSGIVPAAPVAVSPPLTTGPPGEEGPASPSAVPGGNSRTFDQAAPDAPPGPRNREIVRALLQSMARAISLRSYQHLDELVDAVRALGPEAVEPLLEVLTHSRDTRLSIYAALLLGEIQADIADPALAEILRDQALPYLENIGAGSEDPSLRHAALTAMGRIGDAHAFDFLVDAISHEDGPLLIDQAARSLTSLRGEEITEALSRLALEESDDALRARLAGALAGRHDPAAVEALSELSRRDFSEDVRLEATRGLAALPEPAARDVLRDIVRSPDRPAVRAAALEGLGRSGDETDLGLLDDVLWSEGSNEVRTAAYRALSRIGTEAAREAVSGFTTAARVEGIASGGNAAAAGLLPQDLILEYDGREVSGARHLQALVGQTEPNRLIAVRIVRDGRTLQARVVGGTLGITVEDGVIRQ